MGGGSGGTQTEDFVLTNILGSLIYNLKCPEVTVVGNWHYMNKIELNQIDKASGLSKMRQRGKETRVEERGSAVI